MERGHLWHVKPIARMTIGWSFIVTGMAGLFLPPAPGCFVPDDRLVILSKEYRWAGRLIARVRCRFPEAYALRTRARSSASKILRS